MSSSLEHHYLVYLKDELVGVYAASESHIVGMHTHMGPYRLEPTTKEHAETLDAICFESDHLLACK